MDKGQEHVINGLMQSDMLHVLFPVSFSCLFSSDVINKKVRNQKTTVNQLQLLGRRRALLKWSSRPARQSLPAGLLRWTALFGGKKCFGIERLQKERDVKLRKVHPFLT